MFACLLICYPGAQAQWSPPSQGALLRLFWLGLMRHRTEHRKQGWTLR